MKTLVNSYARPMKEEIIDVGNFRPESPYTTAIGMNNNGDVVGYAMKTGQSNGHHIIQKWSYRRYWQQ